MTAALAAFFPSSPTSAQESPNVAVPFYSLDVSDAEARTPRAAQTSSVYASKAVGPTVDASRPISLGPNSPTLQIEDVAEFSAEPTANGDAFDGELSVDASLDVAPDAPIADETATVEQIAEECFFALDPYSSLFIDYPPTADWTNAALLRVDEILPLLATEPERAAAIIKKFRAEVAASERIKDAIVAADPTPTSVAVFGDANDGESAKKDAAPTLETRYSLEQRLTLFEAFRCALNRRAFVWGRAAEVFAAKNRGELVAAGEISVAELARIRETTAAAQAFFGDSEVGRNWRTSFEIDLLLTDVDRTLELASPKATSGG
ncbi:MAG: hypothetical protein IIY07_01240, partial [Thermoguttaceae bacterium]|nr:hypothetical protein [Thermoguttaceae bacterium]